MEDVELLVNRRADMRDLVLQQAAARKRERKRMKLFLSILASVLTAICALGFGITGSMHPTLAWAVSTAAAMYACFALGLYVARRRK